MLQCRDIAKNDLPSNSIFANFNAQLFSVVGFYTFD